MKGILLNLVWLIVLTVISIGYLSTSSAYVPPKAALLTNFVFMPIALGVIAFSVFSGPLFQVILWACVIAIVHVFWFGGDSSKPGLENALMYLEFACIALGVGIAWSVKTYLMK